MNEITLMALGIVGTCVGALIWLLKYIIKDFSKRLDKNTAAHEQVAKMTELNTASTAETLKFLKNLNGRLADITAEKIAGASRRTIK